MDADGATGKTAAEPLLASAKALASDVDVAGKENDSDSEPSKSISTLFVVAGATENI